MNVIPPLSLLITSPIETPLLLALPEVLFNVKLFAALAPPYNPPENVEATDVVAPRPVTVASVSASAGYGGTLLAE